MARPLIENGAVVGCVVGIVKDRQTHVLAYGETTKGSGVTPHGATVYEIGSISKVFTGVLLADRVRQGVVKVNDRLQEYLPTSVKVPVAGGKPITLEHLATHTSGLPRLPDNFGPADPSNPYADYTVPQMHAFLRKHELRRPPGKYEYSNYGMGLLGHILARQAGVPYEQLLIERICEPLGMRDTRITLDDGLGKRLAPPYNAALTPDKNWDLPTLPGAGAIRSSGRDMLKFIEANLADNGKSITQALHLSHRNRHTMKDGQAMGLGWHIARDGITRWHNGMTGGYHSWLAVVPDRGVGVVVLANTANIHITKFGEQVTRVVMGIDVQPPKRHKVIQVDLAVLKSYIGFYAITPQFGLTVTVEDGQLMAQATGQEKFQVFAVSNTEFFYKVVDAQITFVPNRRGEVNKLILHQGGHDQEAVREN